MSAILGESKFSACFFAAYPDPFQDSACSIPAKMAQAGGAPLSKLNKPITIQNKITSPARTPPENLGQTVLPTLPLPKPVNKTESQNILSSSTPPDSPTSSCSKHRRNVSDTSTFNK